MSLLEDIVATVLRRWTALNTAVAHGWGGAESQEKFYWLHAVIEEFLQKDEVFADELSDYIDDIVTEEFHMMCEDNSCEQVARVLTAKHALLKQGKTDEIKEWLAKAQGPANVAASATGKDDEDDEDDECDADDGGVDEADEAASSLANVSVADKGKEDETASVVDDDGWTTVTKKGKGKRR